MTAVSNRTKLILNILKIIVQVIFNILIYTVIIIMAIRLCTAVYDFSYQIFGNMAIEEAPGTDFPIEINKGEGTMKLATDLENKGLIVDKYTFYVRVKLSTSSRKPILPGIYKLNTSMSYEEIISVITNESTTTE
ncbi:MAG: endolytic transglycosylase MltG [Velocimicrobium sp.]